MHLMKTLINVKDIKKQDQEELSKNFENEYFISVVLGILIKYIAALLAYVLLITYCPSLVVNMISIN